MRYSNHPPVFCCGRPGEALEMTVEITPRIVTIRRPIVIVVYC